MKVVKKIRRDAPICPRGKPYQRTIQVQWGPDLDHGRKETALYSKRGPLVVTRELDTQEPTRYVVTHTASGMAITRTHKLAQARTALHYLLSIPTDWSRGRQELASDTDLRDRVVAIMGLINLVVRT